MESPPIETPARASARVPITPTQEAMLADALARPGSGNDIEQIILTLPEPIDPSRMREAWSLATARHDALGASFDSANGTPVCICHPGVVPEWTEIDWSAAAPEEAARLLEEWLASDRRQGFKMDVAPLHRCCLIRRADDMFIFVWTVHHILIDGRSFARVIGDAFDAYEDIVAGRAPRLAPAESFAAYAARLAAQDRAPTEALWRAQLAGFRGTPPVVIHDPPPRAPASAPRGEVVVRTAPELTARLRARAEEWGVALSTFAHGAWALALARYTGAEDVAVGAVLSHRRFEGFDARDTAGNFIHVAPIRTPLSPDAAARPWLQRLRERQLTLRAALPLSARRIQACAEPGADALYHALLLVETRPWDDALRARGGAWRRRGLELREQTAAPLTLSVYARESLELRLMYDCARYAEEAARRLLEHAARALEGLVRADPDAPLSAIRILSDEEHARLALDFNRTDAPFPEELGFHEIFEAQVAARPDAPAVTADGVTLSYGELDRRAERLAARLAAAGVRPEAPVAVLLPRGLDLCVSILAVWKAGGAYVPLDPAYPQQRLAHMLADCGARVCIAPPGESLSGDLARIDPRDLAGAKSAPRPAGPAGPRLAYVLFTSGTTGSPKGVLIEHRSLVNEALAARALYDISASDRALLFSTPSFDASIEEMCATWAAGAHVVVRPPGPPPALESFVEAIERDQITILDLPTAFWHVWMSAVRDGSARIPQCLRAVIVGGEMALQSAFRVFRQHAERGIRFINTYGPTECTIVATAYEPAAIDAPSGAAAGVPLGWPLANTTAYVVTQERQLAPFGVEGELLLGGAGVARGYWNRPEETARAFVSDPFASRPGARLYRTGDRAWRRSDGALIFAGRLDDQIKIRGHRVELGEIEAALVSHPDIGGAAVVPAQPIPGHIVLVAYWAGSNAEGPDAAALREHLAARLPPHMIPAAFVRLPSLPLTPNGKIDRRALPNPVEALARAEASDGEPMNDRERLLSELWREILGVAGAGPSADFFALGGDSLAALKLAHRLRDAGLELDIATLFRRPTLKDVARAARPIGGMAREEDVVVRLTDGLEGKAPLFLMPSDFGDLLVYANLAPLLDRKRTCIGLQCPRLYDGRVSIRSMADLAAFFARRIEAVHPSGPCLLAGYCFGGLVAMDVANRLRAAGREIALLCLIDARPSNPATQRIAYAALMLRGALRARAPDWVRFFRARLRMWREARALDRLARMAPEDLEPRVRNRWFIEKHLLKGYRSSAYPGAIAYIFPEESRYDLYEDPSRGWRRLAASMRLYRVTGSHVNMMKEPHVRLVADALQRELALAEQASQ